MVLFQRHEEDTLKITLAITLAAFPPQLQLVDFKKVTMAPAPMIEVRRPFIRRQLDCPIARRSFAGGSCALIFFSKNQSGPFGADFFCLSFPHFKSD